MGWGGWPISLVVPSRQRPDATEVAGAFSEPHGLDGEAEAQEPDTFPEVIRTWNWWRLFLMGLGVAAVMGVVAWWALLPSLPPPARQPLVQQIPYSDFARMESNYLEEKRRADAATKALVELRAQLRISSERVSGLQSIVESQSNCGRPDSIIDQLNKGTRK